VKTCLYEMCVYIAYTVFLNRIKFYFFLFLKFQRTNSFHKTKILHDEVYYTDVLYLFHIRDIKYLYIHSINSLLQKLRRLSNHHSHIES